MTRESPIGFRNGCETILKIFRLFAIIHAYFAVFFYITKYNWSPFFSSLLIRPEHGLIARIFLVCLFGIPQLWLFVTGWASVLEAATLSLIYVYAQLFLITEIE
jgi:hypothetical protein